jgi:hypothetical protein
MSSLNLHHATFEFLVQALVPTAVQQHSATVLAHLDQFVQAYDPGQAKSKKWVNIDYNAVHQWVGNNSSNATEYEANWALAASAVFFRYDGGSSTAPIPDPCPGCWGPTPLQAVSLNGSGTYVYTWVWEPNAAQWVRVCVWVQGLVPTQPSPPIYPEVVVGNQVIAVVRGAVRFGQEVVSSA